MTLCSNAIGTNRVKFRFGDSLGFIADGGFGDSKALPAKWFERHPCFVESKAMASAKPVPG